MEYNLDPSLLYKPACNGQEGDIVACDGDTENRDRF